MEQNSITHNDSTKKPSTKLKSIFFWPFWQLDLQLSLPCVPSFYEFDVSPSLDMWPLSPLLQDTKYKLDRISSHLFFGVPLTRPASEESCCYPLHHNGCRHKATSRPTQVSCNRPRLIMRPLNYCLILRLITARCLWSRDGRDDVAPSATAHQRFP